MGYTVTTSPKESTLWMILRESHNEEMLQITRMKNRPIGDQPAQHFSLDNINGALTDGTGG